MVRHRMRNRRSGTRGGSSRFFALHSHHSASAASSAENPCQFSAVDHYPNTRSGRGRACLHCSRCDEAAMHITTFPLPPHHIPHTTQFRFQSSMNSLVFIATVSICISEEPEPQTPMTTSLEETNIVGPSQHRDNIAELNGNGGWHRRHGQAIAGSLHDASSVPSDTRTVDSRPENTLHLQDADGSKEGDRLAEGRVGEDKPDDWAFPIVEEPAPYDLGPHVTLDRWQFT